MKLLSSTQREKKINWSVTRRKKQKTKNERDVRFKSTVFLLGEWDLPVFWSMSLYWLIEDLPYYTKILLRKLLCNRSRTECDFDVCYWVDKSVEIILIWKEKIQTQVYQYLIWFFPLPIFYPLWLKYYFY